MSEDPQNLTAPIEPETEPEPETTDPEPVEEPEPEGKEDPLKIWITEITTRLDNLTTEVKNLGAARSEPKEPEPQTPPPPQSQTLPQSPKRQRPVYRWRWQKD